MDFRIADTFTDSLGRLTGDEQKLAKTTSFDLQMNPAGPGLSFHKLGKAKDKNFWSVRVSRDIRLIVHKTAASILLCYVDHHDAAYQWAERRKLETHPTTGAAQLVEIRETVKEIIVPVYVQTELPAPVVTIKAKPIFAEIPDKELLGYGLPLEWLGDVKAATEDSLLALADHLPAEAAEALLELATGGTPKVPAPAHQTTSPFDHPDAQRRFRVMTNVEELERALEFPWEKWTVFLHPEQRDWVERDHAGPARISGSAGTGKTIVALHRAVYLARTNPDARILLATFSNPMASALRNKLGRLIGREPRLGERIDVRSFEEIGRRMYLANIGAAKIVESGELRELIASAAAEVDGHKFGTHFLVTEWEQVVDAWQLKTWEEYRNVARLGRKTRLPEAQRETLWSIYQRVRGELSERGLVTQAEIFSTLATITSAADRIFFDFVVVDEAQDLSVSQMRFLAALGNNRPNALFFAGDLGQRIFQQPFSWRSLGVDIRGRSRTLRVNYRTSHQIRTQADLLLGPSVSDVDGVTEKRNDTVSVFNGAAPRIETLSDEAEENSVVSQWMQEVVAQGVLPHELGVFVRSPAQLDRARAAIAMAGMEYRVLDDQMEIATNRVSIGTMHLAKGLEFRAVAVMACDDEIIPLQERIETVGDDSDLKDVYDTERHLLYVACTRARDFLLITSVEPASEFLDDLKM